MRDGRIGKEILAKSRSAASPKPSKSLKTEVIVVIYNYDSGSDKTQSIWNNKVEDKKVRAVLKKLGGKHDYGTGYNPSGSMNYYKIPKENISEFKKEIRASYKRRNETSPNKAKVLFPSKRMIDEDGNLTGKYSKILGKNIVA
tara:strand:- start:652 stop:1080 length:429 start_codon:yes stop_codon:yes gene_type:complete